MSKEQEEGSLKELPVIAVPTIFILTIMFLFSADYHTQEPKIFIGFFAVTTLAIGAFEKS